MAASCKYIFVYIAFSGLLWDLATCRSSRKLYSNTWVVQVDGGREEAERIAAEKDFILLGQVKKKIIDIIPWDFYRVWNNIPRSTRPFDRLQGQFNWLFSYCFLVTGVLLDIKRCCLLLRLEVWKDFTCSSISHILGDRDAMQWI